MTMKLLKVSLIGAEKMSEGQTTGSNGRTAKAELCRQTRTKKVPLKLRRMMMERRGRRIQS